MGTSEPERSVITFEELQTVYRTARWDDLRNDAYISRKYQHYDILSLLFAQSLPFVLDIPSERALAKALEDKEALQQLCGFNDVDDDGRVLVPTRSTLAHFRLHYEADYKWWVLTILSILILRSRELNFHLPFATPSPDQDEGHFNKRTIRLQSYNVRVQIWTRRPGELPAPKSEIGRQMFLFPGLGFPDHLEAVNRRPKRRIHEELGLPAELNIFGDNELIYCGSIVAPPWLYADLWVQDRLAVSSTKSRSYTAVNVIVLRNRSGRRQILLAERLAGYGSGSYAAPGGKKRKGESVGDCARRELREETGLEIIQVSHGEPPVKVLKARPVSVRGTDEPGMPRVNSIGVVVEEGDWLGTVRRNEHLQHGEWKWYDLDNLPDNLFFPTYIALDDFFANRQPDLTWSDTEPIEPEPIPLWDNLVMRSNDGG